MVMANVSWLDVVMVLMLVTSIGFGFHQGLLRQIVLLVAMYIGTVLSAQYYGRLSSILQSIFPSPGGEMAHLISFATMAGLFTAIATFLLWSAYRETRLPSVVMMDEVGGAALGGMVGVFAISVTLMLFHYALLAPWPTDSPARQLLQSGMVNSYLQGAFSSPLPLIHATLLPWLPSGLPVMLSS
jgi:uncharacterized membrane protein required for colicin V production